MTQQELQKQIEAAEQKIASLREQIAPLESKLTSWFNKANTLRNKLDTLKIAEMRDTQDWAYLLEAYPETKVKYDAMQKAVKDLGLLQSGYLPETGQYSVEVCLEKGDKERTAKQLAGLTLVLPYIKPLKEGYKYIGIFEHTLSQSANYSLAVWPDHCEIQVSRWSTKSVERAFPTLAEAMNYIEENHWYEE